MTQEFPAGYVIRIKALDGIIFLVGLAMLATPALGGFYPGAIDTTVHVTLGALICICSVFRVLLAYGSAWLEVVLGALGVLVLLLPFEMKMMYEPRYNTIHLVAGALVLVLAIVSGLMTFAQLKKAGRATA